MSSTAASNASVSASARAPVTVPTGPATAAPSCSRNWARSLASMYSSSTTRIRLPANVSAMCFRRPIRKQDVDRAVNAVRLEFEQGLGAELVGQRALDQLAPVARPAPFRRRQGDRAFLPVEHEAALTILAGCLELSLHL